MNFKTVVIVKIFCILIVLSLCLVVYFNGKNLDCNKCEINFKQSEKLGGVFEFEESIKVLDLSNNLSKGICLLKWDNKNGYISKINKINLTSYG